MCLCAVPLFGGLREALGLSTFLHVHYLPSFKTPFAFTMTEICFAGDGDPSPTPKPRLPNSRRRNMDFLPLNAVADVTASSSLLPNKRKRRRLHLFPRPTEENTVHNLHGVDDREASPAGPKYGVTSVCGRRRDMEDAVSVHPSFASLRGQVEDPLHFFGVFDGHGCSHVSMSCENRMHEIIKDEIENEEQSVDWKKLMQRSFARMDDEVKECRHDDIENSIPCRCELQTPHQYDTVGSTALVAVVTPEKLIISNCGDSRAVLGRKSGSIPLSSDHKPDRPDELLRIESIGGRVIYWNGARVLGVLATSRAIGDCYLKPYVISEPEVTIMDRTAEDEFIVLASDGLWDVVTNDTACEAVRMYMRTQRPASSPSGSAMGGSFHKTCSDASIMLTKLAMARHSSDNISVVVIDLRRDHHHQQSTEN